MRIVCTLLLCWIGITSSSAQEKNISTQSVEINNFISYVIANYDTTNGIDQNISFLIQMKGNSLMGEELIMLQQGFKLLFERLTPQSKVSLITYEKFGGVALQPTSPQEDKLILHTLTDLKGNIATFYQDGMATAYEHAETHYQDTAENKVVIVRVNKKAENDVVDIDKQDKKAKKKEKSKILLATALALLPELIDVIKN